MAGKQVLQLLWPACLLGWAVHAAPLLLGTCGFFSQWRWFLCCV